MGKSYRIPYTFPSGNFLPTTPYCLKIDLFQNGVFALDSTDPSCTSPNFTADYTISAYRRTAGGTSALFEAINGGYNGHFTVREDPTVAGMDVKFVKLNPYTRIFEINVLLPSCFSPSTFPSPSPSFQPTAYLSSIPSISNAPTAAPSISSAPTTNYAYAVCGSSDGTCELKELIAPTDGLYLVRCCADVSLPDWFQNPGCSIWTRSRFNRKCHISATLSEARQICSDQGGRICTRDEVLADCAKDPGPSGCLMDNGLIWTNEFASL